MTTQSIPLATKPADTLNSTHKFAAIAVAASLCASVALTGCALQRDFITINYTPQKEVARITGAEAAKIKVEVSDVRTTKEKVAAKKNGYGMEMAHIVAKNDVADTVRQAIEMEMANRGLVMAAGGAVVFVELSKLYNNFEIGMWSGTAVAEVMMNVQVKKGEGNVVFAKAISGEAKLTGIQLMTGGNAKLAIEAALQNAVANLMGDAAFLDAVMKAGRS